jgi:glucose-6-phosphate isomerase
MPLTPAEHWSRFQRYYVEVPAVEMSLDVSRMNFEGAFFERMGTPMQKAFDAMDALERGAVANKDEGRMVGHYWLRAPQRAPSGAVRAEIERTLTRVKEFAGIVHSTEKFADVLCIGIGGSALGPMLLADALGHPKTDKLRVHFLDNTDPDGIERVLAGLDGRLDKTLCIVTSKSGETPETRNGMALAAAAYDRAGLSFAKHAVAITMAGSKLDRMAESEGWLERFPMFDWVGGRTSVLSAVGLLPAALQGVDVDGLLAGAAACDEATRRHNAAKNPAALLALMWYHATGGKGRRDMVVLPYKDRLLLFSRYLQQLVMESLGKRMDMDGVRVDQGLSVYGNKGSTDQHAYVQQLRDGVNNFFVVFIRVLESGGDGREVEPCHTAGDYLHGFLLGTREALSGNERESITITIARVDARAVGALIALFERAVGLYASLIHINAYHQPGVEAGKKAAAGVLAVESRVLAALTEEGGTVEQIAESIGAPDSSENVYLLLEHLAANGRARVVEAGTPAARKFAGVETGGE